MKEDEEGEEETIRASTREESRLISEREPGYADHAVVPRHSVTREPMIDIASISWWDTNGDYHEEMYYLGEHNGERETVEEIELQVDWVGGHPAGDMEMSIVMSALEMTARELEE